MSRSRFDTPFTGRVDEKYNLFPSGETNGSISPCVPENGATTGPSHRPSLKCETYIVARREMGKNSGLEAKYAVRPSGVKVIRHCSWSSEITPGAKISGLTGTDERVAFGGICCVPHAAPATSVKRSRFADRIDECILISFSSPISGTALHLIIYFMLQSTLCDHLSRSPHLSRKCDHAPRDPQHLQDIPQRRASAEGREPRHPGGNVRTPRPERRREVHAHAHHRHTTGAGHRHDSARRHRRRAAEGRRAADARLPATGVRRLPEGERREPARSLRAAEGHR